MRFDDASRASVTEEGRSDRNRLRLQECNPAFRSALAKVIAAMNAQGFRPRIQEAWRSEADELKAFASGHSHVTFGYHNASTPDGKPDALAADVLDDEHPLDSSRAYLLELCREARANGLNTGIDWGLPANIRGGLDAAITAGTPWEGPVGFDATHVEITGLTIAQVKAGQRPQA